MVDRAHVQGFCTCGVALWRESLGGNQAACAGMSGTSPSSSDSLNFPAQDNS